MRDNRDWDLEWNKGLHGRRMRRSPGACLAGLIGLLIGIRVIAAVLGVAGIVIGAVFTGLAAAFTGILSGIGSLLFGLFSGSAASGGVAAGIAIGLIAYRMIRKRKESRETSAGENEEYDIPSAGTADLREDADTVTGNIRSHCA